MGATTDSIHRIDQGGNLKTRLASSFGQDKTTASAELAIIYAEPKFKGHWRMESGLKITEVRAAI
jgi:hypothetical protein